jgi:hypothetical protein
MLLADGKARHALLDQEGGDAPAARLRRGLGIDHQHVGMAAVGDPELGAVEPPLVADLFRLQLHRDHVRACPGLRHGEAADMFAR